MKTKLESFENLLIEENPSVFCIQETKLRKPNQIKTNSTKHFTIYELLRKNSSGGGLCIGVHKDLKPVWVSQGDDEVEVLVVEIWVNEFPVRIVTGYGPQVGDSQERKQKFWDFLEKECYLALEAGSGFVLQMDSNAHMGKDILKEDPNDQNVNGKLFCDFLERMPHLTLVNTLPLCEGSITRMRKTTRGVEKSILDFFVVCSKILPFITKMAIDDRREHALTNYSTVKNLGRVVESDHNVETLDIDLIFSNQKPERIQMFDFKNSEGQSAFKILTSNTDEFSKY